MLTTNQAAERLSKAHIKCRSKDVARLANQGLLPGAKRVDGGWQIPEEAVNQLISNKRIKRRWMRGVSAGAILALGFPFISALKDAIDLAGYGNTSVQRSGSAPAIAVNTPDPAVEEQSSNILAVYPAECSGPGLVFDKGGEPPATYIKDSHTTAPGALAVLLPTRGDQIRIQLVISSKENKRWVRLSNRISFTIKPRSLHAEEWAVLEVGGGCGDGETRLFPPIDLEGQETENFAVLPNVDFLTLEPGEFEQISLVFNCRSPGEYVLTTSIPFQTAEERGAWKRNFQLACPRAITYWLDSGEEHPTLVGIQRWTGTKYSFERIRP